MTENPAKEQVPANKAKMLLGRRVHADYHDVVLPLHRGNPFIEALPAPRATSEVERLFNHHRPEYDAAVRSRPASERRQWVDTLFQVFILLPRHYRVEEAVMDSIRSSYGYRNPIDGLELEERLRHAEELDLGCSDYDEPAIGASCIIGWGGTGKTRTVKRVLVRGCPQVIFHKTYKGKSIGRSQLCWIYTTCAHDSAIKAMCEDAAAVMDSQLGTNYVRYVRGGKTEDGMFRRLARIFAIHAVGLWVIDEVQNICVGRPIERKRLARFLVGMQERMSSRIMLVGTPEARSEIIEDLPLLRRTFGENGQIEWEQIMPGKEWDEFITGFWVYKYTSYETKLTLALKRKFWELSLGIPDVAIKLYRMAQREIIGHRACGSEEITIELLDLIAETRMGFAHKLLEAMRVDPRNAKAWDDPKNQLLLRQEASLDPDRSLRPSANGAARGSTGTVKGTAMALGPSDPATKRPVPIDARPILDLRNLVSKQSAT